MLKKLTTRSICVAIILIILTSLIPFAGALTEVTSGIKVGDTTYKDLRVGDTVTYTVDIAASKLINGIHAVIEYDSKKLQISSATEKATALPNVKKGTVTFNSAKEGKVMFTGTYNGGYNFKEENILVTLEFKILDTSYSEIDLQIVDMTATDGTVYFNYHEPIVTDGITIKEHLEISERGEAAPTSQPTSATQPETETTQSPEPATTLPTEESTAASPEENLPKKGIGIGNSVYYIADPGDKVVYTVTLKAEQLFEGFDATIAYDSEKLEFVKDQSAICPNLGNPDANTTVEGIIKISDSSAQGNDFREEKILLNIEFIIKDSAYSRIDLLINEMTITGGNDKYFSQGRPVITNGIKLSENLSLWTPATSVPVTSAPCTETVTSTAATHPANSTAATETQSSVSNTDKTETTAVPASSVTTQSTDETEAQTQSTVPSATATMGTDPTETKGETSSTIATTYLLGDANSDSKVNVKDATYIQKAAASLLILEPVQIAASDCDGNSQVNVRDATAIQKFAADISINMPIGEERVY